MKKLYRVSRENVDYDEYDSAVICSHSDREALNNKTDNWEKVEYLGKAKRDLPLGVVVASYNAG